MRPITGTVLSRSDPWPLETSAECASVATTAKQRPGGDILMYSSAELMHTLMRHDLIDEYRIWVTPVVVGSGKHLFRDGSDTTTLRLVDTKTTSTGVVVLAYQPAEREGEG